MLESVLAEPAKNEIQSLVTLVKNEASYLCCFNSYAQEFEKKKKDLDAKLEDVNKTIDKARGVSHVTSTALQWKRTAEALVDGDVDVEKEKCFNDVCPNCWSQYRKGRDLAKWTLDIDKHLERCNFNIVDGPTDLPGIKHQCIPNFMQFESRKLTFQNLKKALEDDKNMVGLHGLGGTGKTSMAKQVGADLEGSTFGKVIFVVVSRPPNFKKLRGEISKKLGLELKNEEEEGLQDKILHKISGEEKLLIILDDVWEKFDLKKELGIPPHNQHKGCTVLITTRKEDICKHMDCQSTIPLSTLTVEEAMFLFQEHTGIIPILESSARSIVKHCHGVPVIIVAVARSLKGRPSRVWKEALWALEHNEPILSVNDDLKRVYEGLKVSYDNLENECAKKLFLISSLFPEDFTIPMEILIRIGLGMGPFGVGDDYNKRRRKVLDAIIELLDSSLLLKVEEECVKMHDLVHEVALLIGENVIQVANESKQPVKEGLQCLLCDYFPKPIDGTKLESLLIFLHENSPENLEVPDSFFTEMTKLKVLLVSGGESDCRISTTSLLPSIQTLHNLQTLILHNFELGTISALRRLPNLETLWMFDCSIIKLPGEYFEQQKLRFLRIEDCTIEMSNPFELLESCPKLEELTFLSNEYDEEEEDKISRKASFHAFEIYQISSRDLSGYFEKYGSLLSRCFCPGELIHLMSEATFKQLASTSDLLILQGYAETKHKNLVPDIIADEQTKNLIILELYYYHGMQCLIDDVNIHFDVNAFSNLVELTLFGIIGLGNMLFNGNYELCHLKFMSLGGCGKLKSIFLPSTAQSLSRLEKLKITRCDALECVIGDKSLGGEIDADGSDNDQKSYNTLFPKLKILDVSCCGNLKIILPTFPGGVRLETITIDECQNLEYIFDKFQEINVKNFFIESMKLSQLPSLLGIFKEQEKSMSASMQRPVTSSTKASSFSWTQVFCFKSRATSEEANGVVSTRALLDEGTPQELHAPTNRASLFQSTQSLLNESLKNIKKMKLVNCDKLVSVSILSVVALAVSLEDLTISECHKLKNITTHEGNAQVHQDYYSIFPSLVHLSIEDCMELEFLFLSAGSIGLEKLKSLTIEEVPELKYVVGNYQKEQHSSNQNQIDELLHFDLPSLETLKINGAPKINAISQKNYKMVLSSLQNIKMKNCNLVNWTATKVFEVSYQSLKFLAIEDAKTEEFLYVTDLETEKSGNELEPLASSLQELEMIHLSELVNICVGPKCIVCFNSLQRLTIKGCKKLKVIFSTSVVRSLPMLEELRIYKCEDLVQIIEEDYGTNIEDHLHPHEPCFPNLKEVSVYHCDKLKYLFSITIDDMFPKLCTLCIDEAYDLEHVLIRRGDMKEIIMKDDVLPELGQLELAYLPNLISVCDGVDFQILEDRASVLSCPNFSLYETSATQLQEDLQILYSQAEEKEEDDLSSQRSSDQVQESLTEDELVGKDVNKETNKRDLKSQEEMTTHDILRTNDQEEKDSQVGKGGEEKLSLHVTIEQSSNMGEVTQHLLTKDNLVNKEVKNEAILKAPSIADTTKLPIHTSQRDNTNTSAKIFEVIEEDEKEDQGALVTSRRTRSGIKAGNSLPEKKLRTSMDETTPTPDASKNQHFEVWEGTKQKLSSQQCTIGSSNFTTESIIASLNSTFLPRSLRATARLFGEEEKGDPFAQPVTTILSEQPSQAILSLSSMSSKASTSHNQTPILPKAIDDVDHGDIREEGMVQNESKSNVGPSRLTRREQESFYSKGQNQTEDQLADSQPTSAMPIITPFATISQGESSEIVEVRGEEGALILETPHACSLTPIEESIPVSLNSTFTSRGPSRTIQIFGQVGEKGGLMITPMHESDLKDLSSLPLEQRHKSSSQGDPFVPSLPSISSEQQAYDTTLPMSPKHIPISTPSDSTYGQFDGSSSSNMDPSIYNTNDTLREADVQEIVDMMKLDGVEASMLVEAFKSNPQLLLSSEHRSVELLCFSYRVLLNILNILATRTPFTITEADRRLLAKHLNDACVLGFDKNWLESIRVKVVNYDVSEVQHMQQVLKDLGKMLNTKKTELAVVRDQEVKAAQSVKMAQRELEAAQFHFNSTQQQLANAKEHHCQLLQECKEILEQRDQCWETIATKFRHFGF